jgi:DNA-binding transcriptional LysR family regulator
MAETPRLPGLDGLRCFVAAADALNFRRAAAKVGLSPAALSKRIAALEDEVGVALFRRTTRSVRLTREGASMLPYAERALAALGDCVRAGHGELAPAPAELTIGTRHELGMSWIVPLLPRLRSAQAGLTLHLYFGSGADLVQRVASGELDCAVTSSRLHDPRLRGHDLHDEAYTFVGSQRLLATEPLTHRRDARRHVLLDIDHSLPLFAYLRSAKGGFASTNFGRIVTMGTIAAIRALVVRGEGVAVLPAYFVARDLAAGRLEAILSAVEPLHDQFRLVTRGDDPRQPLYEILAETLRTTPLR